VSNPARPARIPRVADSVRPSINPNLDHEGSQPDEGTPEKKVAIPAPHLFLHHRFPLDTVPAMESLPESSTPPSVATPASPRPPLPPLPPPSTVPRAVSLCLSRNFFVSSILSPGHVTD
jgi:hypothetical protein